MSPAIHSQNARGRAENAIGAEGKLRPGPRIAKRPFSPDGRTAVSRWVWAWFLPGLSCNPAQMSVAVKSTPLVEAATRMGRTNEARWRMIFSVRPSVRGAPKCWTPIGRAEVISQSQKSRLVLQVLQLTIQAYVSKDKLCNPCAGQGGIACGAMQYIPRCGIVCAIATGRPSRGAPETDACIMEMAWQFAIRNGMASRASLG